MSGKIQISEEDGTHKAWYQEARDNVKTPEQLAAFAKRLIEDYAHDYGTCCHATSAVAVAAAWCMCHHMGLTGFQAGCVMWGFLSHWTYKEGDRLRIQDMKNLMFPQYERHFTSIPESVWKWAQEEAKAELAKANGHCAPGVVEHWRSIAAGNVPFGLDVSAD
jgi:hypothetical protein